VGEHETQIRVGIDVIEFCRAGKTVDRGRTFVALVGAGKQIVRVSLFVKLPLTSTPDDYAALFP